MLALGNLVPYYLLTVTLASMVPLLAWTVFVVVDCRTLQRVAEDCLHAFSSVSSSLRLRIHRRTSQREVSV